VKEFFENRLIFDAAMEKKLRGLPYSLWVSLYSSSVSTNNIPISNKPIEYITSTVLTLVQHYDDLISD